MLNYWVIQVNGIDFVDSISLIFFALTKLWPNFHKNRDNWKPEAVLESLLQIHLKNEVKMLNSCCVSA